MPSKKIKIAVPEHEGQVSIMFSRGGPRAGAGRKGIGETKKISLTLTKEVWDELENRCNESGLSRSEVIRGILEFSLNENNQIT
ncbi:CopG family transcriptional regulator [Paenibacillus sp. PL91]|uniref:ribbon-helix-helix domain-containing protein n=1 Tax=Paenibacillus sp. PL91 TaxID=2729538 RepID=UPI00145CB19A|nr:CopG family transcriptional regulator [Paenibacillus sp. PL91]MBC9199486.1 ribbon-helix-helix protein, CopG family [Paenibacillus sp. PL91]